MASSTHADIARALAMIFQGIRDLRVAFPHRSFTVDGRLVGDVGEIIAQLEYGLDLDERSQPTHDATTADGMRRVSVKATFKDSLTFTKIPEYMIGLKLHESGEFEEIFNGPGKVIAEHFAHRSGIGIRLLSFPNTTLRALSSQVPLNEKIPRIDAHHVLLPRRAKSIRI